MRYPSLKIVFKYHLMVEFSYGTIGAAGLKLYMCCFDFKKVI